MTQPTAIITPIDEQIKELVIEAKKSVQKAILESGKTQTIWLMTSKDATQMLAEWEDLKVMILDQHNIELPPLIEGVTCKVT